MAAMALAETAAVTRARIAETLGKDQRALSVPGARLIEKGIIEAAVGHGQVQFTLPGFASYVAMERGLEPATALRRSSSSFGASCTPMRDVTLAHRGRT